MHCHAQHSMPAATRYAMIKSPGLLPQVLPPVVIIKRQTLLFSLSVH